MLLRPWLIRFRVLLALLAALVSFAAFAIEPITTLSDGPPALKGQVLPDSSYVEFNAYKLAHPKLLWINWDYLREHGIEFPAEGLTPEFESQIMDTLAYAIPNARDPPETFLSIVKKFFADRYGGGGMGVNWGSGRAASAGKIQIKGIGQTPLVGEGQSFEHAHGRASIEESIREAIWGEVTHQGLPYGGNRTIAIIDTGTSTLWADGGKQANALIIREDPLRPAHYLGVRQGSGAALKATEPERVKTAVKWIDKSLPGTAVGAREYVSRIARQYAHAFATRLFHGTTSASNFEISGRFLDFGTMTAQPGYAKIKVLSFVDPAGDITAVRSNLVRDFFTEMKSTALGNIPGTPDVDELLKAFTIQYDQALSTSFVELTGIPPHLAKAHESTREETLGKLLHTLATIGAKEANVDKAMIVDTSTYDIKKILTQLADAHTLEPAALGGAIAQSLPSEEYRNPLTQAYSAFMKPAFDIAEKAGISAQNLHTYLAENVRLRNAEVPELYRDQMMRTNVALIDEYARTGDATAIGDSIDSRIQNNRRQFKSADPYQLILREDVHPSSATTSRFIYDARSGEYFIETTVPVKNGALSFYGNQIPVEEAEGAFLRYTTNNWKNVFEAPLIKRDGQWRIKIPTEARRFSAEMVLRSKDSRKWWKAGARNLALSFRPLPAIPARCRGLKQVLEDLVINP